MFDEGSFQLCALKVIIVICLWLVVLVVKNWVQPISANFITKDLVGCLSEAVLTAEHHMFRAGTKALPLPGLKSPCDRQI